MNRHLVRGSTLPELLVAMVLSGIVFLLMFEGLSMLRMALFTYSIDGMVGSLYELEHYEMLMEQSDSVLVVGDSARFLKKGELIGVCLVLD